MMRAPSKFAIFATLFCASGVGQASPSVSQKDVPVSAGAEQSPPNSKPDEYTLEPIEISKAIYPQAAKDQKVQGQVVGTILISENGSVEKVDFFKGDAVLAAAAGEAA